MLNKTNLVTQKNTHPLSYRFLGPGSGHSPYVVISAECFSRILAEEILFQRSLRLLAKVLLVFLRLKEVASC